MVSFLNQSSAKGPTDPPKKQSSNNLPKTKDPDFCHQTESWIFLRLFSKPIKQSWPWPLHRYNVQNFPVTSQKEASLVVDILNDPRHAPMPHLLAGQIRQVAVESVAVSGDMVATTIKSRSAGSSWLLARSFLANSRARSLVFWSVARCRRLIPVRV